jgi:hypothetical protein
MLRQTLRVNVVSLSICFLTLGGSARADLQLFANLTHDQEPAPGGTTPLTDSTGAPRPLSFGSATFSLNDAQTAMTMSATVFNIDITGTQTPDTNDNLVNAHIHVGAPPGVNGPVRWGFFGTPDNDTNPDQLVVTPFPAGVGGTFTSTWDLPEGNAGTTLTSNLPGILAGQSYINFHTIQFGGGEIRGQILPEPAGALAAVLTFAAVTVQRKRRARD